MPVLDKNGRPYVRGITTVDPPHLTQEGWQQNQMGSYDGILQYSYMIPGYNPDALIQHRGYEVGDEMLSHGPYISPLDVKFNAILYHQWEVIPSVEVKKGNEDKFKRAQEAADYCRYLIENICHDDTGEETDFRMVLRYVLMGVHQGFSVQEMLTRWIRGGPYDGKLGLAGFAYKRPKQIGFWLDPDTLRVLSLNSYTPIHGFQYNVPIEKFLVYTYKPLNALPYGWGDFRACHKHILVLDLLTKLWGIILERFAGGFLIGHYTNPEEQIKLTTAMQQMMRGSAVALPEGLLIELQQMQGNGVESLNHAIDYHRRMVTEVILGQSLTTSQGEKGSYAHAMVHQDTQEFFLAYTRQDIEHLVPRQIFKRFLKFNYGDKYADVTPRFSLGVWNWSELQLIANVMQTNVDMGALGNKAPVIRQRQGLPPIDEEVEGDLSIEPDRVRYIIQKNNQAAGDGVSKDPKQTMPKGNAVYHQPTVEFAEMILEDNEVSV